MTPTMHSVDRVTRIAELALRRVVVVATRAYRRSTSRPGSLPHFMILGAQKSGTTSLFGYLGQHPQVLRCLVKEVHFFDNRYDRGETWYRSHFPTLDAGPPGAIVGEASPYYLCHPHAPRRIRALLPRVKLIAILRNPTERAISHYFHEVRKRRETLPILEALRAEDERIGTEWSRMQADGSYTSRTHRSFSYKQRGIYADQLERYGEHFDRDQLRVVNSDDLFVKPHETLRRIYEFIGVDPDFRCEDVTARNVGVNRTNVPAPVYEYLDRFFRPHNRRLVEQIGQDFGW
jgi:hypothetical protein